MKKIINFFISMLLISIFLISSFNFINKILYYRKADEMNNEIKQVKTVNENNYNEKLKELNNDYVGWIKIEDTNIDYPILQSIDNEFYLKKNILKEYSPSGSIFLDYRNYMFSDKNTVIYGHYMKNNTLFGELKKFKDKSFFMKNNRIFIFTENEKLEYEVFSAYITDTSFNYLQTEFYETEFLDFIDKIKAKSIHKTDINITSEDKILTLSTCSYDFKDARMVIHAKLVD